jgi:flagellar protein FlaG
MKEVNNMEVSATEMRGAIIDTLSAEIAPRQKTGSPTPDGEAATSSNAEIKQMVEQMQSQLDSMNVSLQYSFYGTRSEKVAVQVVNRETGQVVREIPAKEMQVLQTKMSELVGMIFNDNA